MSQPDGRAELYDASQTFWDEESAQMRESLLLASGYDLADALDLSGIKFNQLNSWAQRSVVRLIGEKLAER